MTRIRRRFVTANLKSLGIALLSLVLTSVAVEAQLRAENDFHVFTNSTSGKIAKFADANGTLVDSIITETSGHITVAGTTWIGTDFSTMPNPTYGGIVLGQFGPGATPELQFLSANAGAAGYGFRLFANSSDAHLHLQRRENSSTWSEFVTFSHDGHVGIGTATPGSGFPSTETVLLHLYETADMQTALVVQNPSNTSSVNAALSLITDNGFLNAMSHASSRTVSRWGVTLGGWNEILSSSAHGLVMGTMTAVPVIFGTNNTPRLTIDGSGNVAIGSTAVAATTTINNNTVINGTLTATKVIGAVYQDVAEWVPATTHMEPGTVVVLNRDRNNEVMPSAHAYDTAVAGVVSAQPGVVLGVASDSKAQVATTGRVKVRVDATAGSIKVGDLLVTSEKSGTAMKSKPIDLGGVEIHRPGTVIGKALEPLKEGAGEILVLLSLQ